jgi:acyl-CoA thioesterase-1
MNWVIYIFGSGDAFFIGVGLQLTAAALLCFPRSKGRLRVASLVALIGLILIALSAAPLPYWFYAGAGMISLSWLVSERCESRSFKNSRPCLRLTAALVSLGGAVAELPYHVGPTLKSNDYRTLYIFADSVTAGTGDTSVTTWPKLMARSLSLEFKDYSQMGATVHSMLRKVNNLSLDEGVVLLEIGGNDLLGSTPARDFERDLNQLLAGVCRPGRTVFMFELPLPPFANEFGRIQRRLAKSYGVVLIPKRVFIGLLTTDGATVDSVHLTQKGQDLMADLVWSYFKPAIAPAP